ncbi:NADP-dependent oxidoreductase [Phenylobacterium sp.]|uniref:NADP-dependent oxidoreductase n=1 Tax=Phenylobacterium sp. TaxID=1871053 RepID=UPI00273721C8|nr:NADP-dependent oxidoreductase [Phenylobacterium sp.]MDP3660778.1 NADP-dependent oxidoreductase [Phenylobacterium sp.]
MTGGPRRWVLASRPGKDLKASDFDLQSFTPADLAEGEVRVRIEHHTVAPGVRAKLMAATYAARIELGDTIPGNAVGVVEASRHPQFAPGDRVSGFLGWASVAVMPGGELDKLDAELFEGGVPLATGVGLLGMSGLTAYFGLLKIGRLKAGETVLVSSAAGAVGSVVGQIARIHDCDVLGLAGDDDKCADIVAESGYDAAINYKTHSDLGGAIKAARPDGVDVFFDNVGGETLLAGFDNLRAFGRVVVCGAMSVYDGAPVPMMPALKPSLRQTVQAFICPDFIAEFPAARRQISQWIREGKLKHRPTVVQGIERAAEAFVGQFNGQTGPRPIVSVD